MRHERHVRLHARVLGGRRSIERGGASSRTRRHTVWTSARVSAGLALALARAPRLAARMIAGACSKLAAQLCRHRPRTAVPRASCRVRSLRASVVRPAAPPAPGREHPFLMRGTTAVASNAPTTRASIEGVVAYDRESVRCRGGSSPFPTKGDEGPRERSSSHTTARAFDVAADRIAVNPTRPFRHKGLKVARARARDTADRIAVNPTRPSPVAAKE